VFVPLEDVMQDNLDLLFPGMEVESQRAVPRHAQRQHRARRGGRRRPRRLMIENELRDRKFAPIVRLEIGKGMSPMHAGMLAAELGLHEGRATSSRCRHASASRA
jgi:polyphosphate kinase